jgi:hypothetical protein
MTLRHLVHRGGTRFCSRKFHACSCFFASTALCAAVFFWAIRNLLITIAEYDNKEFPGIEQRSGRYSFEPEGQFVTSKGVTFNFTMIGAESVEQVFSFFNEVYNKLDCVAYDWLLWELP